MATQSEESQDIEGQVFNLIKSLEQSVMKTVAEFLEAFLPQATPEQTSEMTEAMSMRVGLSFKNGYIHLLDVFKSNIQQEEFKRQ
jgi:hypothetical protein